jgi:drug/metabolite transporter (DMT)-like permease
MDFRQQPYNSTVPPFRQLATLARAWGLPHPTRFSPVNPPDTASQGAGKAKLVLAFAALYTIWGSTYLAIKFAVETIPPYLMSAARFIVSGVVLYLWSRSRGSEAPSRRQWRDAAIVGTLLLGLGNGAVGWAEQRVPSGITALLVASVPMWAVLIDWWRPHGKRPSLVVAVGLLIGLAGVGILAGPQFERPSSGAGLGAAVLIFGSVSWAAGSIYSRQSDRPSSALMSTALQMIAGSASLLLIAIVLGEVPRLDLSAVTMKSFLGWLYLVTFGGLVGFTAYAFVLRETTPAKAMTYAYVNPIVAVLLGWAFANEALTVRTMVAAGIILAGVAMISLAGSGGETGVDG